MNPTLAYLLIAAQSLAWIIWLWSRRPQRTSDDNSPLLLLYASQGGQAETLARTLAPQLGVTAPDGGSTLIDYDDELNLPLAETRRAVAQLQHFDLPCRHLIVNQIIPPLADDNAFWQQRRVRQQEILVQVRRDLAGLQQFDYALQSSDIRGVEALRRFGAEGLMG